MSHSMSDYFERGNKTPWEANRDHINAKVKAALIATLAKNVNAINFHDEAKVVADQILRAIECDDIPNVRIEY
jgi:hypothetical protein